MVAGLGVWINQLRANLKLAQSCSQRGSPASSLSPTWWFSTFGQPHALSCGSQEMADVNALGDCQGYKNVRHNTLPSSP